MLYNFYKVFLGLSIISCAISVSFSQIFLALSFVLSLLLPSIRREKNEVVYLITLFYAWQLLSLSWNASLSPDLWLSLKKGFQAEMKDCFLVLAFFVTHKLSEKDKFYVLKIFLIFSWVLILSGFISIFSETRLSRIISDLYRISNTWPYQHYYGDIFKVSIYLPIGLMNTHLTYGGLLSLVTPMVFWLAIEDLKKKNPMSLILFLCLVIVALLNNARSALLGTIISTSVLIALEGKYFFNFSKLRNHLLLFFGSIGIVFLIAILSPTLRQKIISPLFGTEKHTDSGRTFIWDSTFVILSEHTAFGVGPGQYPAFIEKARKEKSKEHKELLYFYEVTQRGHSHNDYFHLIAIFGLPSVLLYITLGFFAIKRILLLPSGIPRALFLSIFGFYFSGLLQCYFQDDEVLIVFFYILGLIPVFGETEWA